MPHEGYADPITNDRPRFHSDMPVSELTERDTRAIEASVVSSAPTVAKTEDGVTHEIRPTPTEPRGARGLELLDPNSGDRGLKAAHEGAEATSHQTELGEKTQMSPTGPRPFCYDADRVISTFSFDPNPGPSPQNPH